MIELLDKLQNLQLDSLSEEWVEAIFNSEFLEFGDLPSEFESALEAFEIKSVLIDIMLSLDNWLKEEPSISEEKSWAILSHQTHHQKLLCILAYFIDYGNKNVLNKEHRDIAMLSSRLYYKLLSIPGYKAYHIYHSQLFVHSLACLSFPKTMCDNEDNYFNVRELIYEVNATIKELQDYVFDLKNIIKSLQLKVHDMNFEEILSNLVDITGGAIVIRLNIDRAELAKVSGCIYEMIDLLICDSSGCPSPEAIQLVFKCLLPKLVAASIDSRNANERAEIRTARMSLVVGLMSLLPKKSYKDTIKWLLKLSTTAKISHRQIALEILSKFLSNEQEELKSSETPLERRNEQESELAPSSRVHDTPTHDKVQESDVAEEDQTTSNDNDSTEDENSQDLPIEIRNAEQELTEEEIANVLRKRAHTAPHAEIVRAVYERVNDASSALRMRALTILTECFESTHAPLQQAIKELNGTGEVSRLLVVAARCACDERAVVRRAAAALVQRLLAAAPLPQLNDLAILVGLCRDASILVRTTAITGLSELVLQQPSEMMLDAFLTGPMHQLSDPEAKVQEQVVTQIQQILFERIRKHTATEQADRLPWLFLDGIIRHNMRRYLQKACALLDKSSKCINHRIVDAVSTHLGAVDELRDLQCLVLLTSVARHVEYSDLAFLLEYYYKLDSDAQVQDIRILALLLELLTAWSRWLTASDREALRAHLVQRLATATNAADDGCRAACATLAAHLDPENLQWATELMQIAERGGPLEQWVRAADLSLVAREPPAPDLLRRFLAPLAHPPPE